MARDRLPAHTRIRPTQRIVIPNGGIVWVNLKQSKSQPRITQEMATNLLRPALANSALIAQLRVAANSPSPFSDEGALAQIAKDAQARRNNLSLFVPRSMPNVFSPDTKLIARMIFAEATPTLYGKALDIEMAAVAYTVLNRYNALKNGIYPNTFEEDGDQTIYGIIYADGQYGSVDGERWNEFDTPEILSNDDYALLKESIDVAMKAVAGKITDPYANQCGEFNGDEWCGTFYVRTRGSGKPGGLNYPLKNGNPDSRNVFYGVGRSSSPISAGTPSLSPPTSRPIQ